SRIDVPESGVEPVIERADAAIVVGLRKAWIITHETRVRGTIIGFLKNTHRDRIVFLDPLAQYLYLIRHHASDIEVDAFKSDIERSANRPADAEGIGEPSVLVAVLSSQKSDSTNMFTLVEDSQLLLESFLAGEFADKCGIAATHRTHLALRVTVISRVERHKRVQLRNACGDSILCGGADLAGRNIFIAQYCESNGCRM